MAPRGHVKLHTTELKLKGTGLPTQVLANQMAPKIGSGEGEYSNLDTWSAWIQDDWSEGVGKMNPYKNGGVLFSTADTRVPEQMILQPLFSWTDRRTVNSTYQDSRYVPNSVTDYITVGGTDAADNQRLAIRIRTPSANIPSIPMTAILMERKSVSVTVEIYAESATAPTGSALDSRVVDYPNIGQGFFWEGAGHSGGALSTSTNYWLVIRPTTATDKFRVAVGTGDFDTLAKRWNGSAWSDVLSGKYPVFGIGLHALGTPLTTVITRFYNKVRTIIDNVIFTYNTTNNAWDSTATVTLTATNSDTITSAVEFGPYMYIGVLTQEEPPNAFTPTVAKRMNTAGTVSNLAYSADHFARHGGYLWRTYINQVWYSSDASTWVGPITICAPDERIKSMAGIGQIMYFFTEWGIYSLQPGDFVVPVAPWGSKHHENALGAINHQGSLYIISNGRVYRFSEDGSLMDVWLGQDINSVAGFGFKPAALASVNNWLFCLTTGTSNVTTGSRLAVVWVWTGEGWHAVSTLPSTISVNAFGDPTDTQRSPAKMYYDRGTGKLWVTSFQGIVYGIPIQDYTLNPFFDTAYRYGHNSFVEWDWFYGPIREAEKDWESVTLTGEFAAGQSVEVYWKETTTGAWELLGTITADGQELRWAIDDRPPTTKIKLGILLKTNDASKTPRVRSVRLKYHTMTKDWFRWTVPVDVSGGLGGALKQEMPNGERNALSASQIKTALDGLATKTEPMIYRDIDGLQYEVKVQDASFNYTKFAWNKQSNLAEWEGVYTFTLEQVSTGTVT